MRKLNLIFRFTKFKPEMFYSIGFGSEITLQGYFHSNIVKIAKELKFHITVGEDQNNYVKCYRGGIEITLTE